MYPKVITRKPIAPRFILQLVDLLAILIQLHDAHGTGQIPAPNKQGPGELIGLRCDSAYRAQASLIYISIECMIVFTWHHIYNILPKIKGNTHLSRGVYEKSNAAPTCVLSACVWHENCVSHEPSVCRNAQTCHPCAPTMKQPSLEDLSPLLSLEYSITNKYFFLLVNIEGLLR